MKVCNIRSMEFQIFLSECTICSVNDETSIPDVSIIKIITTDGVENMVADIHSELTPLNILLAEDNNILARALTLQLRKLGCQVDWVPNGQDAIAAAAIKEYDLVLLDNKMPLLNGIPAAIQIKKLPNIKSNVSIVILTGGLEQEEKEKCANAGIAHILEKPARMNDLREVLTRVKSA